MYITLFSIYATGALLAPAPAPLADIFVDASNASCMTGTGTAGSPVCSIASAITLAAPGDTVRIAPGTYVENVVISFDLDLVGTSGATVTTIDGGAAGSVVTIPAAVTVTIDGLTLQNGLATEGGGVNVEGTLDLVDSVVTGNSATGLGGGGIGSNAGFTTVTITNSTISGNSATTADGGGIQSASGTLVITNSVIDSNTAYDYGGGLSVAATSLTMTDSTVSGNQSTNGFGGGLEVQDLSQAIIDRTTFSGNTADDAGGAIDAFGGGLFLTNCTVSGNTTTGYGGGISSVNGTYTNSLTHVTVTENSSAYYGGGVYNYGGTLTVESSIIALNTGLAGEIDTYGTFTSQGFNFIGEGGPGFVNGVNGDQAGAPGAPIDPILSALSDNGGPTLTHLPMSGSPVIDTGNPASGVALDQRGTARPQGAGFDIGSVESSGSDGSICNGDGGDQMGCTNCPCGNESMPGTVGGCLNSALTAANLMSTGDTSVTLPSGSTTDLRFSLAGAPPMAFCILNSGDAVAPGNMANPCFGLNSGAQAAAFDGLRCAIMNTRRHGGRSADSNGDVGVTNNSWGGEGGPPVGLAQAGGGFAAGQTRFWQVINRDDPLAICMRGLNTSQAVRVTFTP